MFLTICRYESWSTTFPESFKDSSLGGGVGDNPLAIRRFNLDIKQKHWEKIHLLGNLLTSEGVIDWGESQSSTSNATARFGGFEGMLSITGYLKSIVYSGEFANTAATTSPCLPPY